MQPEQLPNPAAPRDESRERTQQKKSSHFYAAAEDGHILTYELYPGSTNGQFAGSLMVLTIGDDVRHFELDGQAYSSQACIITPRSSRSLREPGRTVGFAFYPESRLHRAMLQLPSPRIRMFDRHEFSYLDDALVAAYAGALTLDDARLLFSAVVEHVMRRVPAPPPLDERMELVLRAVYADPAIPLRTLAGMAQLSSDRLSHVFTQTMGIDLRRYRMWLKIGRATLLIVSNPSLNLTEVAELAGFCDSAHFSRVCREVYGASPSRLIETLQVHGPMCASAAEHVTGT